MVASLTDTRPSSRQRLVSVQFMCGDPGTNPSQADLIAALVSNPGNYFAGASPNSLDTLIAAGWRDHAFLWYGGRGGTRKSGCTPLNYPGGETGIGYGCDPLNEAQHEAVLGNRNFLTALIAALDTAGRRGSCFPFNFYCGQALAESAIDAATLDNLITVPSGLGGIPGFDAQNIEDYDNNICTPDATGSHLKLWFSSDSSAAPSAWLDRSGTANNALQGTGGLQPTVPTNILNGRPVVRYDGTNDRLVLSTPLTLTAFTLIVCCKSSASFGSQNLLSSSTTANHISLNDSADGDAFGFDGANIVGATAACTPGSFDVISFVCNGSTLKVYKNGVQSGYSTAQTFTGLNAIDWIGDFNFGSKHFKGDFFELALTDRAETDNVRGLIEREMAVKAALSTSATATLPQRALIARCLTRPVGETWELKNVVARKAWASLCSGMVASKARADVALADATNYYTRTSIVDAGSRPIVYIQSTDGTAPQKQDMIAYYANRGNDVWCDFGSTNAFTASQIAASRKQFDSIASAGTGRLIRAAGSQRIQRVG